MASFIVVHDVGVMSFGVDKSCDVRGLKDFGMKEGFCSVLTVLEAGNIMAKDAGSALESLEVMKLAVANLFGRRVSSADVHPILCCLKS